MTRFLLDTNMVGHFVHDRLGVNARGQDEIKCGNRIEICSPVLGELRHGVEYSQSRDRNALRVTKMLPELLLWPFDRKAAFEYGRIAADLKRRGRRIQQIDIQIAAIAKTLRNCTIVTTDTDFDAIPGLAVEDWTI